MTYLITFAAYGWHIHGDECGSVDRAHNVPGSRLVEEDPKRASAERRVMDQQPYLMDEERRKAVRAAIEEVCEFRGWMLIACHVRSNHVHVVLDAEDAPEKAMLDFKSYASGELNRLKLDGAGRKRWARHGSTRWLWTKEELDAAIVYVVSRQGEPMAVFERPLR